MESESWTEESDGGSFAVELKANLDEIERVSGAAGDYRGDPTFHETFDSQLHSISLRIDNSFDLIHFRSVCSSWRSSSILFRPKTSLRCPLLVYSSGYGDDRYILSRSVYLLKSSDLNGPRYWLFKLQEKENGDIVLHSLFLRRNTDEYRCSYPTFSLDLLRCQVFELAQEHLACSEPCEGKVEGRIGFMSLDAENNEFMVLGRLPFKGPAVYRSIDGSWTELQITQPVSFEGIVSYKSKFYAIDLTGRTIVVEPTLQLHTFQRSRPSYKTRKRWVRRLKPFISLLGLLSFRETKLQTKVL